MKEKRTATTPKDDDEDAATSLVEETIATIAVTEEYLILSENWQDIGLKLSHSASFSLH